MSELSTTSILFRVEPGYEDTGMKIFWLEKAAQQDHPRAINDLGVSLTCGDEFEDLERALELFKRAESLGVKLASVNKLNLLEEMEDRYDSSDE